MQAVKHPVLVLLAAVAVLGGTLTLVPRLGSEFLPELNEGSVWVNLTLPPGISVTQAVQECARVRHILRQFPEVRSVVSKAGRPEDGTDPKQVNMAEFLVDLYPEDQWKRKITKNELLGELQKALEAVPGLRAQLLAAHPRQHSRKHFADRRPGGDQGLRRRYRDARRTAPSACSIRCAPCAASIARSSIAPAKCRNCRSKSTAQRAARYGLNVVDVQNVIETALGGKEATEIWEGERKYPVVVRLREDQRADLDFDRPHPDRYAARACAFRWRMSRR